MAQGTYRKKTDAGLSLVTAVGAEATTTTHNVTIEGDAIICTKEVGATPAVGDYIMTNIEPGIAGGDTTTLTHLPIATFNADGWRKLLGAGY